MLLPRISEIFFQANYSFSGAFRPLSKLIVCAVMLRGRHRGLPVAIDRAVILPFEFRDAASEENNEKQQEANGFGSQDTTYANGTFDRTYTTERSPSEKLQRRSWRTRSMRSMRSASNQSVASGQQQQRRASVSSRDESQA